MPETSARLRKIIICTVAVATALAGPAAQPAPATVPAWSAAATAVTVQEEKSFRNGDAELSGTLYLPRRRSPVGLVVVTHSASKPQRDALLYRHLIEMMPALGMGVFIYDRRGSGKSGGELAKSDYAMLADDAVAAVRMLKADPRIDPHKIGIWGLSQGGWLSLLAAARSSDVRFVVSISAPLVPPDVQMMFRSENLLRINGYPESDIEKMRSARQAVDDYMRGKGDRATAQKRVDAIKGKPWFDELYMGETVSDRESSRWRKEIEFDPLSAIDRVKVPALILFGAANPVVPVAISAKRIEARQKTNIAMHVVAGADHHMVTTMSPKAQMDPRQTALVRPDSAEYFAVLANWLTTQGLTARRR